MHSGAKGPGVAEYFARQQVRDSAHFAWSIRYQGYAQCVNLYHVAWHCAGSRLVANNIPGVRNAIYSKLNWNAIGIELPGPYDKIRGEDEFDLTRLLIEDILNCPLGNGIKAITRHRDIDMGKKDPGKGFTWEWVDDFGLYIFEHRRFSVK
jgi:N-acetyl-anhydromuramyl-L-alanine amidase AmpD